MAIKKNLKAVFEKIELSVDKKQQNTIYKQIEKILSLIEWRWLRLSIEETIEPDKV